MTELGADAMTSSMSNSLRVLVIGQGGREHALVKALFTSPSVTSLHALPGSSGMKQLAACHEINWTDFSAVFAVVQKERIDLVVIGPENILDAGLSDYLREREVLVFGPSREAARLESSKVLSKKFMVEAGAPTARYHIVSSVAETLSAAQSFAPPYVLKADGLAAGKGVTISQNLTELKAAAEDLFVKHKLGAAGDQALLEEFSPGYELSYLILTNGEDYESLVLAQDHKRLSDGDRGPNTGGMGTIAPMKISPELDRQIRQTIIQPVVAHLKKQGLLYRGVLFVGLMITPTGPSVIEFNVRFGDPETQVILPLLQGDWGQVFKAVAEGQVPQLKWQNGAACCVVLAAEGYPESPVQGVKIAGDLLFENSLGYFLHAGSQQTESGWLTNGGRVLNAVGLGKTVAEARRQAYEQAEHVSWPGLQMRSDIGIKAD